MKKNQDNITLNIEEQKNSEVLKRTKHPTIKDVALLAGVSSATVGRVIGEYGYVSPESREKVRVATRELGFNPNAVARSLKSRSTKTLGYMLPSVTNLFYAQIAKGLQDIASTFGYNVILCSTDANTQRTAEFGRMLLENRVDGIVLSLPADDTVYKLVDSFKSKEIPIVICHGARSIPGVDRVMCDDYKGGYIAAKHLLDLGHRRVGIITVKGSTTSNLRLDGFRQAFKDTGNDITPENIIEVPDFSENAGYTGTKLLMMRSLKPTAIITANDIMAMGAVDAIDETNLNVPNDVSVIGFDNTFAAYMKPKLSTVSLPMYQVGQIGAQMLFERLEKRYHGESRTVILPEELIMRGSTAVVKTN